MKKKLRFIDLFAGIGGFHLVLKNLGMECVFASEINPAARKTYQENHGSGFLFAGDIEKVPEKEVPDHEILCAGFPCQAFSVAGKRQGFEDTRGTLFFHILRIAKEKKPKVLFLENVANLKKHDQGKTFEIIKTSLEELGYKVSEEVLNAKDFGMAQSRERIIIVASLGKRFDFGSLKKHKPKKISDILDSNSSELLNNSEYTLIKDSLIKQQKTGLKFVGYRNKNLRVNGVLPNSEHLSRSHKQPNRIYDSSGTHPTLSSQETSGRYFVLHQNQVRKLSLIEVYRLQGFPSDFIINSSKSEAYRQIGNSVPLGLIKSVAEAIKSQLF